jgi:hypothetical protein
MTGFAAKRVSTILVALAAIWLPAAALAGAHTWDVNEVFSNADGTIQFVELREANGTPGEVNVHTQTLFATTPNKSFPIGGSAVAPPTSNKFFLFGTAAFAALPGAPAVDRVIPAGVLPNFFNPAGGSVTYGPYDTLAFAKGIPTNGIDSFNDPGTVAVNSPTNYAGQTGSVDASPPPHIPSASSGALLIGLGLLMAAGVIALMWRRQSAAA